ncbi:MAG: inositol monophosphatase family protein [Candidatus Babeliaceae bacterium]
MLDSIHHIEPIMRHAGQLLMSFYHQHLQYFDKKNEGFFTKADVSVEDYLKHALAKLYPEIGFLAEESGQQLGEDQKHQWVIDPLDGTTNFARNIPYFCISIALVLNKKTVFGIIFDPLHDELFWAFEKKGAWQKTIHGIKQLTVSKVDKLERSLVLVGIPYAKNEAFREVFRKAEVVGIPLPFVI